MLLTVHHPKPLCKSCGHHFTLEGVCRLLVELNLVLLFFYIQSVYIFCGVGNADGAFKDGTEKGATLNV